MAEEFAESLERVIEYFDPGEYEVEAYLAVLGQGNPPPPAPAVPADRDDRWPRRRGFRVPHRSVYFIESRRADAQDATAPSSTSVPEDTSVEERAVDEHDHGAVVDVVEYHDGSDAHLVVGGQG